MRWDELFDDLEGRLRAEEQADLLSEVADRTRRERALLGLHERLLACVDAGSVTLRVAGLGALTGRVGDVGSDWVLLGQDAAPSGASGESGVSGHGVRSVLVTFTGLRSMTTPVVRQQPVGAVARSFGLGAALRAVSRDRSVVEVVDLDGTTVCGTVDGVGRDLLDLAEHPADLPRRVEHVVAVRSIPLAAVAAVRRLH